jgi:hypothetical protein
MKLQIHSKKDGFRRAGLTFSQSEPTVIDTEALGLNKAQIESLKAEPNLVVVEVQDKKEQKESGEKAGAPSVPVKK